MPIHVAAMSEDLYDVHEDQVDGVYQARQAQALSSPPTIVQIGSKDHHYNDPLQAYATPAIPRRASYHSRSSPFTSHIHHTGT